MPADVVCISKITEKSSFLCKSSLVHPTVDVDLMPKSHMFEHLKGINRKGFLIFKPMIASDFQLFDSRLDR